MHNEHDRRRSLILTVILTYIMGSRYAAASSSLRKVAESRLYVSEPDPRMFGNRGNEGNNPSWTNSNWLKSRFHFSFAEYNSRHNTNFGVLRVMNDDLVQPARGFGAHPHRDAEICTYVVRGALSHKDSQGNEETLGPGSIQFMTAGTGVTHSEHNHTPDQDLRFIQMWLTPRRRGLTPNYGSLAGTPDRTPSNEWQHLVSDTTGSTSTPVQINTDANIFVATLTEGKHVQLPIGAARQAYLLCVEGGATIEQVGETVQVVQHDAVEVHGTGELGVIAGPEGAHVLVVEMAAEDSAGRTDL